MPAHDGNEPVADDEYLYRRIPVSKEWYDENGLSPEAFRPRRDEETGISVFRAKYKSIEDAAKGMSKHGYYVAVLRAGDLRNVGIQIIPQPNVPGGYDPSHAELPDLTCHNLSEPAAMERMGRLTDLALRVEGPFLSSEQSSE
jgi:hypothetical protein